MDREGMEREVVGGYSFGATVALYVARHYPQRVSGVVALAGKHIFDARTLEHWRHLVSHERIERVKFPNGVRRVEELVRLHAPNAWKDVVDANARLFATFAADQPLPESDLRQIRAPVMIVSSNLDQIVPWTETMALGRALPDAHVAMFYGPAHPLQAIPLPAIARNIHEWMVRRKLA
jgi:pimeloyl-ACP methyl ester carboxylesterase